MWNKRNSRGELIQTGLGFLVTEELAEKINWKFCNHKHGHAWIEASESRMSMVYPDEFVEHLLEAYIALKKHRGWLWELPDTDISIVSRFVNAVDMLDIGRDGGKRMEILVSIRSILDNSTTMSFVLHN